MDESSSITTKTSMLCCDPNGQSIGVKGTIDPNQSGTYTSIIRLASQLDDIQRQSSSSSSQPSSSSTSTTAPSTSQSQQEEKDKSSQPPPPTSSRNNRPKSLSSLWSSLSTSSSSSKRPLISVETDQFVTLIKVYGDHMRGK